MPGDKSLLVFAALDQAALYGLLTRLRDAGLDLIAVEHVPASVPRRTTAQNAPSKEASNAAD